MTTTKHEIADDAAAAARDRSPNDPTPDIVACGYSEGAEGVHWDSIRDQLTDWIDAQEWVVRNPPRSRYEADTTEIVKRPDACYVQVPSGMTGESLGLPASARWPTTVRRANWMYTAVDDWLDVDILLSVATEASGATYLVAEVDA